MKIEFTTHGYEYEYGHKPRGYGRWGFEFEGYEVWAPTSTYSEAKKWCKAKIKELAPADYTGTVYVKVMT